MTVQPALKSSVLTATITILSYDWMCTLDQEVAYVWSRPWSLGTCLFILNRYLPFLEVGMLISITWIVSTPEICYRNHVVFMWFCASGMLLSELILILRTYAIWNGKRSISICLVIVALFTLSTLVAVLIVGTVALRYGPVVSSHFGCNMIKTNDITFIYYLTVLASETIIVTLTIIKTVQNRGSRSSWVLQLSRDGLVFYIFMLGITTANVVMALTATSPYHKNILAFPQRVLHSIFCNRVILLILRQRATHSPDFLQSLPMSTYPNTSIIFSTIVETSDTAILSVSHSPDWTQ